MLTIKYQNEFEKTLSKALSLLIFAKPKDREMLAEECKILFHKLNGQDTEDKFVEVNERIIEIINSERLITAYNGQEISDYDRINQIHHTRFEKIEARLNEIENLSRITEDSKNILNPAKEISNQAKETNENKISPQDVIMDIDFESATMKEITESCKLSYQQVKNALGQLLRKEYVVKIGVTEKNKSISLYSKAEPSED